MHGIDCVVHTFQLAIKAAFNQCRNDEHLIDKARDLIKLSRMDKIMNLIVARKLPKPKIDMIVRWLSTFETLKSLFPFRECCEGLS